MSRRVLVVEDHEDNRRILRDLLEHAGYEMIEAVTGEEGLALADSELRAKVESLTAVREPATSVE